MARPIGGAAALAIALALGAGCGDDGGGGAPPPPTPAVPTTGANPRGPATAAGARNALVEKPHIEDRVACPIPDAPSDPKATCDPSAPSCGEHLYCLPLAQGNYCEPCPERDGIRHAFRERDFDEHNRDPFQPGIGPLAPPKPPEPGKKCPREDQNVATSYSYTELKLVGIVAQGTQRKVLMMGGPLGYIIKRGDCVGKERAIVKDIGAGYITFQLDPETVASARPPEDYSVQLNPKQLMVNEPELPDRPPRTVAPVAPPPAGVPPRGGPAGAGSGSGSGAAVPIEAPPGKAPPGKPGKPGKP